MMEGVSAECLLAPPQRPAAARLVAIADAEQTSKQLLGAGIGPKR
jgi:hypothetical protein